MSDQMIKGVQIIIIMTRIKHHDVQEIREEDQNRIRMRRGYFKDFIRYGHVWCGSSWWLFWLLSCIPWNIMSSLDVPSSIGFDHRDVCWGSFRIGSAVGSVRSSWWRWSCFVIIRRRGGYKPNERITMCRVSIWGVITSGMTGMSIGYHHDTPDEMIRAEGSWEE